MSAPAPEPHPQDETPVRSTGVARPMSLVEKLRSMGQSAPTGIPPAPAVKIESDEGDFLFIEEPGAPAATEIAAEPAAPDARPDTTTAPPAPPPQPPDSATLSRETIAARLVREPRPEPAAPTVTHARLPAIAADLPPTAPLASGNISDRPPDLAVILRARTEKNHDDAPQAPARESVAKMLPPPDVGLLRQPAEVPPRIEPAAQRPVLELESVNQAPPPPPRLVPPRTEDLELPPPPPIAPRNGFPGNIAPRLPETLPPAHLAAAETRTVTRGLLPLPVSPPETPAPAPTMGAGATIPPQISAVAQTPAPRHLPVRQVVRPRRKLERWIQGVTAAMVRRSPEDDPHAHLTARTRADERFSRTLTLSGAVIILPALLLGWRHLVPDNAQMLDRLLADGRLREAAALADRMAEDNPRKNGPDYRFLSTTMMVESAASESVEARRLAFARTLEFARQAPADALRASAAVNAMRRLGESAGAADFFADNCKAMPTHVAALWAEGLSERLLAENNPAEALRITMIGWDAAPGVAVSPESLLRVAKLAGKPEAIHSRLRQYVVTGGRFDKADVYREVARETGNEAEAIRTLWPYLMMRIRPSDYADLSRAIMASGPTALRTETAALVDAAMRTEELPFESGIGLIRLCLSRGLTEKAAELVGKLDARRCETPEFLRLASDCKLWTNHPDEALGFLKRAYFRTGAESDFRRAFILAGKLESTRDLVALCEHRGLDKLSPGDRPEYASALTALGEYETALRVHEHMLADAGKDDAETLRKMARLQRALRRTADAAKTYGRLIALEPKKQEWRDQEFRLLITLGQETEAIAAAERNWRDIRDARHLGEALTAAVHAGDDTAILRIAMEAENAVSTGNPPHLLDACYYLQLAGKNEPRIRILSALAARFPERTDIAMELVTHDYDRGRFDEVEKRFVKLPALADNRDCSALRLSAKLAIDNREDAGRLLKETMRTHPEWLDHAGYAAIATETVIRLKDDETAEALTERFLARREATGSKHYTTMATRLLLARGMAREALPLYRSMNEELDPALRLDYAWALSACGNFEEAESQMLRAIDESGKPDAKLFGSLGDLRLTSGASESAREAYRKALKLLEKKS